MKRKHKQTLIWYTQRVIHYVLLALFCVTYAPWLRLRYRMRFTRESEKHIKGPCLLLGNHGNSYDGVMLHAMIPKTLHFVVTDHMFKNRILAGLMRVVNYVPKKKFVSDVKAIKQIASLVKRGGIIGIFPEGRRNWDGQTVHISQSTAKLVRMLKIPVVAAKIEGSYLSNPRWAYNKRRGRIYIELKTIIKADEVADMALEDIAERIEKSLWHDEYEWQRQVMIPYKGKDLALGFERLMFVCPECRAMGTIWSQDNSIGCTACGATYHLDVYGFVHSDESALPSDSVSELNIWQRSILKKQIESANTDEVCMQDEDAWLETTTDIRTPYQPVDTGPAALTKQQLRVGATSFALSDIYGVSVIAKSHLFFRSKSRDYRISFKNAQIAVYKWYCAITFAIGEIEEVY